MSSKLSALFTRGVRYPIMQAGMPGAAHIELAVAVATAGGIGSLGLQDLSTWEQSLAEAKRRVGNAPINANLLLPYTRRSHVDAVLRQQIPLATLFWGNGGKIISRLQAQGTFVFQQVGSIDEASRALDQGVDALIAQGSEAGGHVRGTQTLHDLLPAVAERAGEKPVFAAGGIYTVDDVRRVQRLGASGISTGSRFLLTDESNAHDEYKARLIQADKTLLTTLFGLGWATPHRVAVNAATQRWCREGGQIPGWLQAFNRAFGFTRKTASFKSDPARAQRPHKPIFTNAVYDRGLPGQLGDALALYAGEHIGRLNDILPAAMVVQELAAGFEWPGDDRR